MAKFKVGDKVTYWVFDKKAKGDVKAVRGERVDIDDGRGGVVTFKAKDLEVWNTKACNSSNPVVRKAMNANACGAVKNATMGEIIAQLNGAKIKEAYKLGRSAAETLARCADVLADSGLARAWPEFARDFGDVRGKLTHWLATVEGEFRSLIR